MVAAKITTNTKRMAANSAVVRRATTVRVTVLTASSIRAKCNITSSSSVFTFQPR